VTGLISYVRIRRNTASTRAGRFQPLPDSMVLFHCRYTEQTPNLGLRQRVVWNVRSIFSGRFGAQQRWARSANWKRVALSRASPIKGHSVRSGVALSCIPADHTSGPRGAGTTEHRLASVSRFRPGQRMLPWTAPNHLSGNYSGVPLRLRLLSADVRTHQEGEVREPPHCRVRAAQVEHSSGNAYSTESGQTSRSSATTVERGPTSIWY
jgi:hypothetical protein